MTTRVAIIWNPSKTEKEPLESALTDALGDGARREVRWWETTVEDPGQGMAEAAIAAGTDLLVVAGGNGTVRAVAEHLADARSDVDMAIVPLGTGNLFARNIDVPINARLRHSCVPWPGLLAPWMSAGSRSTWTAAPSAMRSS